MADASSLTCTNATADVLANRDAVGRPDRYANNSAHALPYSPSDGFAKRGSNEISDTGAVGDADALSDCHALPSTEPPPNAAALRRAFSNTDARADEQSSGVAVTIVSRTHVGADTEPVCPWEPGPWRRVSIAMAEGMSLGRHPPDWPQL